MRVCAEFTSDLLLLLLLVGLGVSWACALCVVLVVVTSPTNMTDALDDGRRIARCSNEPLVIFAKLFASVFLF